MTRHALRNPRLWLAGALLLTAIGLIGLSRLQVRTDGAFIYPLNDPIVEATRTDRARFREPERVLVLVTAHTGHDLLASPPGLAFLAGIHRDLSALPEIDSHKISSLANQIDVLGDPKDVKLPDFLSELPSTPQDFNALMQRIRDFDAASGLFLASDGSAAALYLPVPADVDRRAFVQSIEAWIAANESPGFEVWLTGPVVAETTLGLVVLRDLAWLVPLMVAVMALLALWFLRTPAALAVILVEICLVLLWTFAAMAFAGAPVTLVTTILPVVLMTMAIADEIHLLERLASYLPDPPSELKLHGQPRPIGEAALRALTELRRPILLTSLTTACGFLSFLTASILPLRHFGLFTALGILLAMLFTFTLIPALLVVMPASWFRPLKLPFAGATDTKAGWRRPSEGHLFVFGLATLLLAPFGFWKLSVQDAWVDNFSPDSDLVRAERIFNSKFWGSYRFDVVLQAESGFFGEAPGMALVENLVAATANGPRVGGVASYMTLLGRIGMFKDFSPPISQLSQEDRDFLVRSARFVSSRILLDEWCTWEMDAARVRLFVQSADYRISRELETYLRMAVEKILPPGVSYHFSGDVPQGLAVVSAIVGNQLRSIFATLAGIALLLWCVTRRLLLTLAILVPVIVAALWVLTAMGLAGLPLGIATSMFTALLIGAGVDFSLHFTERYRIERRKGHDHNGALALTRASTGRAIFWNATIQMIGFLVLALSALKPNRGLGWLLAAAMLAAYAATSLLLPKLLCWVVDWRGREP